jgi:hypothetical protein
MFFGLLLIGYLSLAAPTANQTQKIQFQCKTKAKELAQTTYTSCLNDAREIELDKVKQDYKEKLDKLKTYYDRKIKSLSGSENESKAKTTEQAVEEISAPNNEETETN